MVGPICIGVVQNGRETLEAIMVDGVFKQIKLFRG